MPTKRTKTRHSKVTITITLTSEVARMVDHDAVTRYVTKLVRTGRMRELVDPSGVLWGMLGVRADVEHDGKTFEATEDARLMS